MDVVLSMHFCILNNADVQFAKKKLSWRTYTIEEALSTTRRIKIIDQKKLAKATLDKDVETIVVHVSSLRSKMTIYPAKEAQLALLLVE